MSGENKSSVHDENENLVIDYFTDPVYALDPLYGIEHKTDDQSANHEEHSK